jgi:CRP-like cAMP-binding protein
VSATISRISRSYRKDEAILQEGAPATEEIFYLHRGTCLAEVGGKVVGQIESGEFFGELASILQSSRSATVRAATDCIVYVFQGLQDRSLAEVIRNDPSLTRKLFEQMALRLVESSHRHAGDAQRLTALAHRYRAAISGALFALAKIKGRHPEPDLEELYNFLRLASGIAEGRPQDLDLRYFPRAKEYLSEGGTPR